MVSQHVPSCHVSRNWRGEKADFGVIPTEQTDANLLREFGMKKDSVCWSGELTPEQADSLKARLNGVRLADRITESESG